MPVVSLADAKTHLNMTGTSNDTELQGFLDSAIELVSEEAGVYDVGTYTETLPVYFGCVLLSHTPVTAVTSVVSLGETITGATFSSYGRLTGLRGWREVTVTYTAGTAVAPARFRTAVLMVVARLWETQRGNSPTILQGGEEPTFTPGLQGILGEVRALLGGGGIGTVA